MEKRVAGIEPALPDWKSGALPLSYTRVARSSVASWIRARGAQSGRARCIRTDRCLPAGATLLLPSGWRIALFLAAMVLLLAVNVTRSTSSGCSPEAEERNEDVDRPPTAA